MAKKRLPLPKLDAGPQKIQSRSPARDTNARRADRKKTLSEKLTTLSTSVPLGKGKYSRAVSAGLSGAAIGAGLVEAFSSKDGSTSKSKPKSKPKRKGPKNRGVIEGRKSDGVVGPPAVPNLSEATMMGRRNA